MNDKFLRIHRIMPRSAFAQNLHQRLEIHKEKPARVWGLQLRPVALGALTLLLVLSSIFAISPAARAQVQNWIGQVGGVFFTITGKYPGGYGPVTTVPGSTMSLKDARAGLPFTIDLPSWVPEGYLLEETVSMLHLEDGVDRVFIQWHSARQTFPNLELQIVDQSPGKSNWAVGMGSVEEVLVNGEQAALVHGGWNVDTKQWDNPEILTLLVPHNNQTYIFSTIAKGISVDELIRVAESLP